MSLRIVKQVPSLILLIVAATTALLALAVYNAGAAPLSSTGAAIRWGFYVTYNPNSLQSLQANVVVVASLVVLGEEFARFAESRELPVIALLRKPHNLWKLEDCPLCAQRVPLEHLAQA